MSSGAKRPHESNSSGDGGNGEKKPKIDNLQERVKEILKKHNCPVCFCVLIEPVTISPCGHSLCGTCWNRWHERGNSTCPLCRQDAAGSSVPDQKLTKLVDGLVNLAYSKEEKEERERNKAERRATIEQERRQAEEAIVRTKQFDVSIRQYRSQVDVAAMPLEARVALYHELMREVHQQLRLEAGEGPLENRGMDQLNLFELLEVLFQLTFAQRANEENQNPYARWPAGSELIHFTSFRPLQILAKAPSRLVGDERRTTYTVMSIRNPGNGGHFVIHQPLYYRRPGN